MSENKLNTAKQLLGEKRYDEARELLQTINHPTAQQWLAKLDKINPPTDAPKSKGKTQSKVPLSTALGIIMFVALTGMVVFQQWQIYMLNLDLVNTIDKVETYNDRINVLEEDLAGTISVLNSHADDINSLASDLRSVASVANNADSYAHSHGYSDANLKTDIVAIENPLERVLSLRGVVFTWNNAAFPDLNLETGRDYGLLAQELALVFPELVSSNPTTGLLQVDYEGLIPVLIEAIQEQQVQIDALQTN
jgi:hypothetical protein